MTDSRTILHKGFYSKIETTISFPNPSDAILAKIVLRKKDLVIGIHRFKEETMKKAMKNPKFVRDDLTLTSDTDVYRHIGTQRFNDISDRANKPASDQNCIGPYCNLDIVQNILELMGGEAVRLLSDYPVVFSDHAINMKEGREGDADKWLKTLATTRLVHATWTLPATKVLGWVLKRRTLTTDKCCKVLQNPIFGVATRHVSFRTPLLFDDNDYSALPELLSNLPMMQTLEFPFTPTSNNLSTLISDLEHLRKLTVSFPSVEGDIRNHRDAKLFHDNLVDSIFYFEGKKLENPTKLSFLSSIHLVYPGSITGPKLPPFWEPFERLPNLATLSLRSTEDTSGQHPFEELTWARALDELGPFELQSGTIPVSLGNISTKHKLTFKALSTICLPCTSDGRDIRAVLRLAPQVTMVAIHYYRGSVPSSARNRPNHQVTEVSYPFALPYPKSLEVLVLDFDLRFWGNKDDHGWVKKWGRLFSEFIIQTREKLPALRVVDIHFRYFKDDRNELPEAVMTMMENIKDMLKGCSENQSALQIVWDASVIGNPRSR